jgi:hypothetical protein
MIFIFLNILTGIITYKIWGAPIALIAIICGNIGYYLIENYINHLED